MNEVAMLVGGPHDGDTMTMPEVLPRIMTARHLTVYEIITAPSDFEPTVTRHGVYDLRLDDTGSPSRTDTGQVRYDWKGEQ